MFGAFYIMFFLVFALVFGVIVYTVFRAIGQEHRNNQSPRLTVDAKIVSKRTDFRRSSGRHHTVGHGFTSYFVTFEVQSGDRMELKVQGHEFGMLVEGDRGELTFQGTRFLRFERKVVCYDL